MIDFNNKEELNNQLEKLLNKIDETELILLKCHLLVEFAMNHFIERVSRKRSGAVNDSFSFLFLHPYIFRNIASRSNAIM